LEPLDINKESGHLKVKQLRPGGEQGVGPIDAPPKLPRIPLNRRRCKYLSLRAQKFAALLPTNGCFWIKRGPARWIATH